MSDTENRALEVYTTGLRNQHAVENQAIKLLERQLGRLENYPEMSDRMRRHIEESKGQARRIEELLSSLGTSESSIKDTALSFVGNMLALGHAPAADEVIKNTLANFAFEHYEIASYRSLLTLAEPSRQQRAIPLLQESLREEEAMAEWIADHIAPTTLRFVQRSAADEQAGL